MSVEEAIAPVPGWYSDPTGGSQLRWWSGAGWTDHVAPTPAPEPASPASAASAVPGATPLTRRELRMAQEQASGVRSDAPAIPEPAAFGAPTMTTTADASAPTADTTAPEPDAAPAPPERNWWTPAPERTDAAEPSPSAPVWRPMPKPIVGNTSGAWTLAFIPLIGFAISLLYTFIAPMFGFEQRFSFGIGIAAIIAAYRAAKSDRDELVTRGFSNPPHPAWVLLTPVAYLGIRLHRISRAGGRAAGPFWVALGTTLAQLAIIVLSLLTVLALVWAQNRVGAAASDVSTALQHEMLLAGYNVTVACPEGIDYSPGSTFTCAITDPDGVLTAVDVSAEDSDGQLFYQITSAR